MTSYSCQVFHKYIYLKSGKINKRFSLKRRTRKKTKLNFLNLFISLLYLIPESVKYIT